MSDEELHAVECAACPSAGSCGGQFTANTMACVSEAIGLALPGSAGAPAPYESRDAYAEASGHAVMHALAQGIRPRDIVTLKRSEAHTSELQSLMRQSYAVFCLKKKKKTNKISIERCNKKKDEKSKDQIRQKYNLQNNAIQTIMNLKNEDRREISYTNEDELIMIE